MKVRQGDTVAVLYTGRLDSGEVFDSNVDGDPLQFTVGAGEVIPGFEKAVLGLGKGEKRTVRIPPEEAYGARRDELVQKVGREMFGDAEVEVGMHFNVEDASGNVHHADVVEISDDAVTIDLNPHLAGEALTFDIEVVGITNA